MTTFKATSVISGARALKAFVGILLVCILLGLLLNLSFHELIQGDKPHTASRESATFTHEEKSVESSTSTDVVNSSVKKGTKQENVKDYNKPKPDSDENKSKPEEDESESDDDTEEEETESEKVDRNKNTKSKEVNRIKKTESEEVDSKKNTESEEGDNKKNTESEEVDSKKNTESEEVDIKKNTKSVEADKNENSKAADNIKEKRITRQEESRDNENEHGVETKAFTPVREARIPETSRGNAPVVNFRQGVATEDRSNPQQLPKCLIIGFSNCWTMTLAGLLSLHPDVVTPDRQIQYFTLNRRQGVEWYRRLMPPQSSPSQITIERTSSYIMSETALDLIHRFNSSIKLLIIVRDPIFRLLSTYAMQTERKLSKPTFEHWCGDRVKSRNVLWYIDYARPIQNVFNRFSRKQVLVLSKEELETKPNIVMRTVENFLGLKPAFSKEDFVFNKDEGVTCFNTRMYGYPNVKKALAPELDEATGCLGSAVIRKTHPEIDDTFYEKLLQLVKVYNDRLFRMIDRKFNWTSLRDL